MTTQTVDLLGLDAAPAPPQASSKPSDLMGGDEILRHVPPQSASQQHSEVIMYPPANQPSLLEPGPSPVANVQSPPAGATVTSVTEVQHGAVGDPRLKRYLVRCEGRWRIRSAPSLNSKVIGTVANGTFVLAYEEAIHPINVPAAVRVPEGTPQEVLASQPVVHSIGGLWLRVAQFEAQDPMAVSEIKRDLASGGAMFCLRRNALGYGLYEVGVEPQEGPLVILPETLASELRSDAQQATADKSEDVSLTWKLLGAADSFSRFVSKSWGTVEEGGVNEDMKAPVRRRPEEVFEVKQREQLRKAAASLKKATEKIIEKAGEHGDATAGLPKETRKLFSRVRASLAAAAKSHRPLVVAPHSAPPAPAEACDGSNADLKKFVEVCTQLEQTGGWTDMSNELKREVLAFNANHLRELEDYARSVAKGLDRRYSLDGANLEIASPSSAGVVDDLLSNPSSKPADAQGSLSPQKTSSAAGAFDDDLLGIHSPAPATAPRFSSPQKKTGAAAAGPLPFLAPPPPPSSGVAMLR